MQKDPSKLQHKVKNTFLEVSLPEDPQVGDTRGRRSRSDGISNSPLVVAAKSPNASPGLHPVDETMQAVPIDEVDFELLEEAVTEDMLPEENQMAGKKEFVPSSKYGQDLGDSAAAAMSPMVAQQSPGLGRDEPAYVVPTTPSPFLHSAFPPTVVPPFGYGGMGGYMGGGGLPDMGLPPAYGHEGEAGQDGAGGYMQGMEFMPGMYDPSCAPYMPYGWPGMPMDPNSFGAEGIGPDGQMMGYGAAMGGGEDGDGGFGDGFVQGGGMGDQVGASEGSGRKERRKRGKKDAQSEDKAQAPGAGARDKQVQAPQVKAGDLDSATAANQAALAAEEEYTTVMLRNIPNKYTREMLIKQLSVDFKGMFDFMYLPIDFKNKCNVGYGFINFRTQEACEYFVKSFHGVDVRKCLPGLNSKKVVEVTPARVQGLIENVRRLRNSPVMNQLQDHPEWMPLLFNENGQEEPFPSPDQPLPPVKPRGRARVEGAAV